MLEWQHKSFPLKPGFANPDRYLEAKLCKSRLHNGVKSWAMSPIKYTHKAVRNCIVHLLNKYGSKYRMPKKAENLFKMGFDPELDTSPESDSEAALSYLPIIDILWWMIALGRIDIIMEISLLSSHVAVPRDEHLEAA